jgi:hypothetical protein
MKLSGWWNWRHLRDAEQANGSSKKNIIALYGVHLCIGLKEAGYQLVLALCSLIHAVLPFSFNFKLLELVVNQTIGLHKFLPQHPIWDTLRKELNDTGSK